MKKFVKRFKIIKPKKKHNALIMLLASWLTLMTSAVWSQDPGFIDPHEHIADATERYFADESKALEKIGVALDLEVLPTALEPRSNSRGRALAVKILDSRGFEAASATLRDIRIFELTDEFALRKKENLERNPAIDSFESSLVVGQLKLRSKSLFILGKYEITAMTSGRMYRVISLIDGGSDEGVLVDEAAKISFKRLGLSRALQNSESTPGSPGLGFLLEESVTAPARAFHADYLPSTPDDNQFTAAPRFLLAQHDPQYLYTCLENCYAATNDLIVEYTADERRAESALLRGNAGGVVNCSVIAALSYIPAIRVLSASCAGAGVLLFVANVAVGKYYDGLRDAALAGCYECELQCYEYWGA